MTLSISSHIQPICSWNPRQDLYVPQTLLIRSGMSSHTRISPVSPASAELSDSFLLCPDTAKEWAALASLPPPTVIPAVTQENAAAGILSKKTKGWRNSTGQAASVGGKDRQCFGSGGIYRPMETGKERGKAWLAIGGYRRGSWLADGWSKWQRSVRGKKETNRFRQVKEWNVKEWNVKPGGEIWMQGNGKEGKVGG